MTEHKILGIDFSNGEDYTTTTEPVCKHCGKSLSEALRKGCGESPCREYKEPNSETNNSKRIVTEYINMMARSTNGE